MGSRLTRSRRRAPESGGPSKFFLIALAIGVLLLLWVAWMVANTPMKPN